MSFVPGEPSHWYGDRACYRVHDDRGRFRGGVRGTGRPVGPRRHRRVRESCTVIGSPPWARCSGWRCTTRTTRPRTTRSLIGSRSSTSRRAIAWQPGTEAPDTGELSFGGWIWRYDLEVSGPCRTRVTPTYDWSAVPPPVREYLQFPPFRPDHLDNSLQHLSELSGRWCSGLDR